MFICQPISFVLVWAIISLVVPAPPTVRARDGLAHCKHSVCSEEYRISASPQVQLNLLE